MINSVRNTVQAIANKNNYGYISPQDFNLYAQQAQMDLFEDYFYQYNSWINKQNQRVSGTGYADIVKSLVEVIDSFSVTKGLIKQGNNMFNLPADYYYINKINYYPKTPEIVHHKDHVDFIHEHKGGIFYLNDNDGLTVLEDGTEIKRVANRLLLFDSSRPHHSTTCTNANRRLNINFNYF